MANTNYGPTGLQPVKNSTGGYLRLTPYYAPASLASLGQGTPVALSGSSNTVSNINGANYPIGSLSTIAVATGGAGNAFIGSIVAMDPVPTSPLTGNYNAANTGRVVWVADHPDQRFYITDDGTNALTSTSIGLNCNLTIGTVSSTTFIDSTTLTSASPAVTQNYQVKILGIAPFPNNTIGSVNGTYEVMINQHQLANNTVGV
jgi:hypothetical protein